MKVNPDFSKGMEVEIKTPDWVTKSQAMTLESDPYFEDGLWFVNVTEGRAMWINLPGQEPYWEMLKS